MDGLTLGLLSRELENALIGGRIDRVVQPERDEVILTVRNGGVNHLLLLTSSANCARAQLTQIKKPGPLEPPSLCMLMRKHLIGARVAFVRQRFSDRILEIGFDHYDELGDRTQKRLVCEFMGKHSNVIFVGADDKIIESTRHVNEIMSSVREILPGLKYVDPPAHGKIPYDQVTAQALSDALRAQNGFVHRVLLRSVSGLSPQLSEEIALRATGAADAHLEACDPDRLGDAVVRALDELQTALSPRMYRTRDGAPMEPVAFEYRRLEGLPFETFRTLSEAMDAYYATRDARDRIEQKSAQIHRVLKNNIERCQRKLALQQEALKGAEKMELYRLSGELLTASPHLVAKGAKKAVVPNYYEADLSEIEIPLDERLNAQQNAQRYFKLYQKARNARSLAAEQILQTQSELNYLEGQMDNLRKCTEEAELSELRQELEKLGYLKANLNRRQLKQLPPSSPLKFTSSEGATILVGKNNLQNDKLTFSARPEEVWLHAKDIPGSHVIIVGEAGAQTLLEAAQLAAAYSGGRSATRVAVDYTLRKYVKKPSGAKPGFVTYTHQKTLFVKPAQTTPDGRETR